MKFIYVFLLLTVLCFGCNSQEFVEKPIPAKTVIQKYETIESRPVLDFNLNIIMKSVTVYYFLSEDNSIIEVDLKTYLTTKVGDKLVSRDWK